MTNNPGIKKYSEVIPAKISAVTIFCHLRSIRLSPEPADSKHNARYLFMNTSHRPDSTTLMASRIDTICMSDELAHSKFTEAIFLHIDGRTMNTIVCPKLTYLGYRFLCKLNERDTCEETVCWIIYLARTFNRWHSPSPFAPLSCDQVFVFAERVSVIVLKIYTLWISTPIIFWDKFTHWHYSIRTFRLYRF